MRLAYGLMRAALWALAMYGLLLFIVMHTPVSDWFVRPLVVPAERASGDVLVVLAASATPDGTLNEAGFWRTLEAVRQYRMGRANRILLSGNTVTPGNGDPTSAMASMLRELEIPEAIVEFERESTNTHESAVCVARLARGRGWHRLIVVTDAKHMRRARAAFLNEGFAVIPAPTMVWEMWWGQPYDRHRKFLGAVHEYFGLVYYWWKGWI